MIDRTCGFSETLGPRGSPSLLYVHRCLNFLDLVGSLE
jgi:hypothetical protein